MKNTKNSLWAVSLSTTEEQCSQYITEQTSPDSGSVALSVAARPIVNMKKL